MAALPKSSTADKPEGKHPGDFDFLNFLNEDSSRIPQESANDFEFMKFMSDEVSQNCGSDSPIQCNQFEKLATEVINSLGGVTSSSIFAAELNDREKLILKYSSNKTTELSPTSNQTINDIFNKLPQSTSSQHVDNNSIFLIKDRSKASCTSNSCNHPKNTVTPFCSPCSSNFITNIAGGNDSDKSDSASDSFIIDENYVAFADQVDNFNKESDYDSPESSISSNNADDLSVKQKNKNSNLKCRHKSDEGLKRYAMNQEMNLLWSCKCNDACKFGKNCVVNTTLLELAEVRNLFWKVSDKPGPTSKERGEALRRMLTQFHDKTTNKFKFTIGRDSRTREICEQAWLRIIGISTPYESARPPRQYLGVRDSIALGDGEIQMKKNIQLSKAHCRGQPKRAHATAWIKFISEIYAESGYDEKKEGIRYLPYNSFRELYDEYQNHYKKENKGRSGVDKVTARKELFRQTWRSIKNIRLRTAKGAFETCCVCNNLNDFLKNSNGEWSRDQLEIVVRLKRLHLEQQAQERLDSIKRRIDARESFDKNGNPKAAYLEFDGYTEYKTKTPIQSTTRRSKGDTKRIGNRVIGVIVTCGPIDTRFVYSLNDLIAGGANIMIEVVRQGKLLAKDGFTVPKDLYFQFDNCGENKNKFMFAYLSYLAELEKFDNIYINFLVVGHTHTTIDQYFSVITRKILSKKFVGSPIALQELFGECLNPSVNRPIEFYHDYKSYFQPIINVNIRKYQLPHCFKISRICGRAVCVHKPFSTSPEWLPSKPTYRLADDQLFTASVDFNIEDFGIFGGLDTIICATINASDELLTQSDLLKSANSDAANRMRCFSELTSRLRDISVNAVCESMQQMEMESSEGYQTTFDHTSILRNDKGDYVDIVDRSDTCQESIYARDISEAYDDSYYNRYDVPHEHRKLIQKEMLSRTTAQEGYIFWLDWSKVDEKWYEMKPQPVNYYQEAEITDLSQSLGGYNSEDEVEDQPEVTNKNKKKRSSKPKTLVIQLKGIVNAAKDVLAKIKSGFYSICENVETICDFGGAKRLSMKEEEFYKQHSSVKAVLTNLKNVIDAAPPFKLFPDELLSNQQKKELEDRKQIRATKDAANLRRVQSMIGSRAANLYLSTGNAIANNVMSHQLQPTQKCEVAGCVEPARNICRKANCKRHVCQTHGPAHNKHSSAMIQWKEAPLQSIILEPTLPPISQTAVVQSPSVCAVNECNEEANFVCDDIDCGIKVCAMHGPKHQQHRSQHISTNKRQKI